MLGIVHYRTRDRWIGVRFGTYGWTLTDPHGRRDITREERNEIWQEWIRFHNHGQCTWEPSF